MPFSQFGSHFNGQEFQRPGVTIIGARPNETTWGDAFQFDNSLLLVLGNDHWTIGFGSTTSPILIEFSHTIRPLLFEVAKRYLATDVEAIR